MTFLQQQQSRKASLRTIQDERLMCGNICCGTDHSLSSVEYATLWYVVSKLHLPNLDPKIGLSWGFFGKSRPLQPINCTCGDPKNRDTAPLAHGRLYNKAAKPRKMIPQAVPLGEIVGKMCSWNAHPEKKQKQNIFSMYLVPSQLQFHKKNTVNHWCWRSIQDKTSPAANLANSTSLRYSSTSTGQTCASASSSISLAGSSHTTSWQWVYAIN